MAEDRTRMAWSDYMSDQIEVERLVRVTWGDMSFESAKERGLRVQEEGIETAQALGGSREEAHRTVDMVFDKKPGEFKQEIGGVVFTLLALCANKGVRLDEVFAEELARFRSKDPQHFRDKQALKAGLDVSIRSE